MSRRSQRVRRNLERQIAEDRERRRRAKLDALKATILGPLGPAKPGGLPPESASEKQPEEL